MSPHNEERLSAEELPLDHNGPWITNHDDGENNKWGKGIVKEFKATVGTWWVKEMTNFNLKTIPVSFFIFFAASHLLSPSDLCTPRLPTTTLDLLRCSQQLHGAEFSTPSLQDNLW
jgi:hypothetical protein